MAHPPAEPLVLLAGERVKLEKMASSPSLPHRMVREAKGLLLAADGVANAQIAERLGVSRSTVLGWRKQFADDGVKGVGKIRPGRGPKTSIPQEKIDQVVHDTRHTTPPDATQWSVRSMAKHAGISKSKVQQIWSARGLEPHLSAQVGIDLLEAPTKGGPWSKVARFWGMRSCGWRTRPC